MLFLLHQLAELVLNINITLLDNYLDPFCASVIILHGLALERKFIFEWSLTTLDIIIAILILSVISELVFPYFSNKFTADIYDFLAFSAGGLWFYFLRKDLITENLK